MSNARLTGASGGGSDRLHAGLSAGGWSVGGGVVGPPGGGVVGSTGGGVVGPGFVEPVQVVPFSANDDGTGLLPVHDPLKPNDAVPPVAMPALWAALRALTWSPFCVTVEFHACVTR